MRLSEELVGDIAVGGLETAPSLAAAPSSSAVVRGWAMMNNIAVPDRGRLPAAVMEQYLAARARGEALTQGEGPIG